MPFGTDLLASVAARRVPALDALFTAASFFGEIEGYILLATLVYVALDRRLALRLTTVVLAAMITNHVLKTLIANPRPFVAEGTWREMWLTSPERALELVREYSTPSGHAMAAAAFWGCVWAATRRPWLRALAIAAMLLVGLSRPYLGVHYLEDILLGWPIGLLIAWIAVTQGARIAEAWARLPYAASLAVAFAFSLAVWAFTLAMAGGQVAGQPDAFVGYVGLLTGLVAAVPLERRFVGFDPAPGGVGVKLLRYALALIVTFAAVRGLGWAVHALAPPDTTEVYALQYLRYVLVGVTALFLVPWLLVRLHMAPTSTSALGKAGHAA